MRRASLFALFFILSLLTSCTNLLLAASVAEPKIKHSFGEGTTRRILHQPLFPATSPPPSPGEELTPPSFPDEDQPFIGEVPAGPSPDQLLQPPPALDNGTPMSNPIATTTAATATTQSQQSKPVKKVAIAISVGIVTLGMLSALAFYVYKHKVKHSDESQSLVGNSSQRINQESSMPPPAAFAYIGAIEPSAVQEAKDVTNASPYGKLSSATRSDRYRPSPELRPLPRLNKPPLAPTLNSPPPMSSSDEESHDTSYVSNEDGVFNSTRPQGHSASSNRASSLQLSIPEGPTRNPVPHSKRTSPKSPFASSSPEVKHAIMTSTKQPPAAPPAPPPPLPLPPRCPVDSSGTQYLVQQDKAAPPYGPKRPKFPAPPPPSDMTQLQSINNEIQQQSKSPSPTQSPNMLKIQSIHKPTHQPSKTPLPPPPPPPPPPPSVPSRPINASTLKTTKSSSSTSQTLNSQSCSFAQKTSDEFPNRPSMAKSSILTSSSDRRDGDDDIGGSKRKLKPLHWDKVRASPERGTVWDQLKSSSFQLNEDMMESLFGCNSVDSIPKDTTRKLVRPPPVDKERRVLDPKKSQNIAILLRALNVTRDEVTEALVEGHQEGLGLELLETLVKMAPTKEEEIKLREYNGDCAKLGSAERFLKAILDVPYAFKRVEAMLYRANFDTEVKYLRSTFQTLEEACRELKNSRLFLKLLEAVLRTGNRMNDGTNRGDARAFKLDTLLKLVDIKGTDGKTTLLHFVVQEIIRSEGANPETREEAFQKHGLQIVAGLGKELNNVKKAAGMDSDVLHSYVVKLETGLEKVRSILQYESQSLHGKFFEAMKTFLGEAEEDIVRIKAEERKALSLVREVTVYFHGSATKEEAHPFRIFMIVRDFLCVLDNVCKEVGRMREKTIIGTARSFRIAATASLPVLTRFNVPHDSSDDDSLSP